MAVYLDIEKSSEEKLVVEYTYSTTDKKTGRFTINRETGITELIELAPDEVNENLYLRAAHKIKKAWGAGELPEKATWAS